MDTPSKIILADGTIFEGRSFGAPVNTAGEVVFNTAMTGYPESLTDPSYEGQILVTTFPLLGNYGVPDAKEGDPATGLAKLFESDKIHVKAIVCQDYSNMPSHWQSKRALAQWLKDEGVAGITDVDTRALTKHLRTHGSMLGKVIVNPNEDVQFYDPNEDNLIGNVSTKEVYTVGNENGKRIVLIDCGLKYNIVRCLVNRGLNVTVVPWDYDFDMADYDALFISNGPGNPAMVPQTVENIRKAIPTGKPICGICMGNQLLALAAGAKTYKLKYGHRSHNQPVREVGTNRCLITSQNHGFAVDSTTIPSDWEESFVNINDGSNEGIRHKTLPIFSAQFHPEASSGPKDAEFLFDRFTEMLYK